MLKPREPSPFAADLDAAWAQGWSCEVLVDHVWSLRHPLIPQPVILRGDSKAWRDTSRVFLMCAMQDVAKAKRGTEGA